MNLAKILKIYLCVRTHKYIFVKNAACIYKMNEKKLHIQKIPGANQFSLIGQVSLLLDKQPGHLSAP